MKLSQRLGISLLGFPIASFIIFIIYFLIYIIMGESTYISEIFYITDINILLKELLVLGVSMFISLLSLFTFYDVNNKYTTKKHPILYTVVSLILLIFGFAFIPLLATQLFFKNLPLFSLTFFLLWIILVTVYSLIEVIRDFINKWIINKKSEKVNKVKIEKIKTKNIKNKDK